MADSSGRTLVLSEYQEKPCSLSAEEERQLRALVGHRLTTAPGSTIGEYRVKAMSFVGTVVLGDLRILVRPKVPTDNLFHMLEADGRALDLAEESFGYGDTGELAASFATFYGRALERGMGAGVPHEYVEHRDDLAGIRGRIDFVAQRRRCGVLVPIACEFDEYTVDTQLNRILRAAAERMLRVPGVTMATRRRLVHLISRLVDVGPLQRSDLARPTTFTRLNSKLKPAHGLARLILEGQGIVTQTGTATASVFMIDMNKVFERFVEARLRSELTGRLLVHGQRSLSLDTAGAVAIRPDLVFGETSGARDVYVADAKYKIAGDGFGREADYYQLLAYCAALDLDEGLLIYCQHDGSVPPRAIEAKHVGTRLKTHSLSLGGTIADLEESVRALAEVIITSASTSVRPAVAAGTGSAARERQAGLRSARSESLEVASMTVRSEILRAFDRLERRHARVDFQLADIVMEVQSAGSTYAESSIRTHVVSVMCVNAPVNHGTTYRDLERVAHGRYRRLVHQPTDS